MNDRYDIPTIVCARAEPPQHVSGETPGLLIDVRSLNELHGILADVAALGGLIVAAAGGQDEDVERAGDMVSRSAMRALTLLDGAA